MSVKTTIDQRGVIQERVFVDSTAPEANLTIGVPAVDAQGNPFSGGGGGGYSKKILNIQLDAPPAAIGAGQSHIYNIDLGKPYTHILLTGFQWLTAPAFNTTPDVVFANAVFPRTTYGAALHVTTKPKGWVRGFSLASLEYQNGSPTHLPPKEFYSTYEEVSGALGYGTSAGQTFLNHPNANTNPPAKLQVEDAYIDGQILKITIKNYGNTSVDLTGFIGATILQNYNQASAMGSINDNGVMVYAQGVGAGGSNQGDSVVASTNGGSSWFTLLEEGPNWTTPNVAGITATNDSVNNFVALVNYQYVWTASDSDWTLRQKAVIGADASDHYMSFASGPGSSALSSANIRGHIIDWHKPSSTGLFVSLFNYAFTPEEYIWKWSFGGPGVKRMTDIAVFKSVDNFENYGGNHPLYNDKLPFASGSGLVADFKYPTTVVNGQVDLTNMRVKVVDGQTYYVTFPYASDPETYPVPSGANTGRTNPILGAETLVYDPNVTWTFDPRSIVFDATVPMAFSESPSHVIIAGSTSGNNGIKKLEIDTVTYNVNPSFIGPGSWTSDPGGPSEATITLLVTEIALQKVSVPLKPLPGSDVEIVYPGGATTSYTTLEVREVTAFGRDYYVVKLGNRYAGGGAALSLATLPGPVAGSPEGEPIGSHTFRWYKQVSYQIPYDSKNYRVFIADDSESAFTPEVTSGGSATFTMYDSCLKQALLKTTDGGATWSEIMTHDDFKYANHSVFASSNDGQTLLLSTMKYWSTPFNHKYPYFNNIEGTYPYFNMSEDGGSTWKYSTGNWKQIPQIAYGFNYFNGMSGQPDRSIAGQVLGKVNGDILGVFIRHSSVNKNPFVVKSSDDGVTWSLQLEQNVGSMFTAWGSDSRDQFLAFFAYYQPSIPLVIYGTVVDSYTNWQAYAERVPAGL